MKCVVHRYWRNEKLGVSSWKDPQLYSYLCFFFASLQDPRRTTTLFQAKLESCRSADKTLQSIPPCQAALDGNLFFLQLYTEVGGFLDAAGLQAIAGSEGLPEDATHYRSGGR